MAQRTTPTLLAALVVCGAGASFAQAAAPLASAPGARVVTVSPAGTTASEPAIAVNHENRTRSLQSAAVGRPTRSMPARHSRRYG